MQQPSAKVWKYLFLYLFLPPLSLSV
jgi:hypothetical protein